MRSPLVRKVIMFTPGQMHPKEVWGSAQNEHSISSVMKPYCIHRTKNSRSLQLTNRYEIIQLDYSLKNQLLSLSAAPGQALGSSFVGSTDGTRLVC